MSIYHFPVFGLPDIESSPESIYLEKKKAYREDSLRIQSVELNNFKGVEYGCVDLYPSKKLVQHSQQSNILAFYGQNGSGKTTIIEAMYLLKQILSDEPLPENAAEIISTHADYARMKTVFEYQRKGEENVQFITYEFSLKRMDDQNYINSAGENFRSPVRIYDELITLSKRDYNGKLIEKTHKLFDSNSKDKTLNGSILDLLVRDVNDDSRPAWRVTYPVERYDELIASGQSVFFASGAFWGINSTNYTETDNPYDNEVFAVYPNRYAYLELLSTYGHHFMFVAGANLFRVFSEDTMPIYLRAGSLDIHPGRPSHISLIDYEYLNTCLKTFNNVLSKVIPGLTVGIEINLADGTISSEEFNEILHMDENGHFPFHEDLESEWVWGSDNKDNHISVSFFTNRGDTKIPLAQESEGIKRIIYTLDLYIAAFNNPGITVAIDEFDAGIFEFLLGELLQIFEKYGHGQLIITLHNLRPLEVINRKYICFTTVNPANRYMRLKYINQTNNLRDVYYRQIMVGEQEEDIYNYLDSFELVDALESAGEE